MSDVTVFFYQLTADIKKGCVNLIAITAFDRTFSDYNRLRDHFRDEHFLCEEGHCVNEQFTSAFRSKIDIKGK